MLCISIIIILKSIRLLLALCTENRSQSIGDTNHDTLAYTNPASEGYAMPYIYADFSFDHCSENFDKKVTTLYKSKKGKKYLRP